MVIWENIQGLIFFSVFDFAQYDALPSQKKSLILFAKKSILLTTNCGQRQAF